MVANVIQLRSHIITLVADKELWIFLIFDDADFPPQDTHSIPQVFSFTIREINHAVRINYVKNIHKSHIKSCSLIKTNTSKSLSLSFSAIAHIQIVFNITVTFKFFFSYLHIDY